VKKTSSVGDRLRQLHSLTTLQSCVYCATVQQDWGRLPLPSSAVVHQKGSKIVLQNVVVAKVRRADLPPKKSSSFCCTTTNQINQSSHILQHTSFLFTTTQSPCKKKSSDYDLAYVLYICSDAILISLSSLL